MENGPQRSHRLAHGDGNQVLLSSYFPQHPVPSNYSLFIPFQIGGVKGGGAIIFWNGSHVWVCFLSIHVQNTTVPLLNAAGKHFRKTVVGIFNFGRSNHLNASLSTTQAMLTFLPRVVCDSLLVTGRLPVQTLQNGHIPIGPLRNVLIPKISKSAKGTSDPSSAHVAGCASKEFLCANGKIHH